MLLELFNWCDNYNIWCNIMVYNLSKTSEISDYVTDKYTMYWYVFCQLDTAFETDVVTDVDPEVLIHVYFEKKKLKKIKLMEKNKESLQNLHPILVLMLHVILDVSDFVVSCSKFYFLFTCMLTV